jgi:hypothetical protein
MLSLVILKEMFARKENKNLQNYLELADFVYFNNCDYGLYKVKN